MKQSGMLDNEFLLTDRLQKIRQIVGQYGEELFYISFSGGKDSTVLSHLVDMALPDNNIPRVFANTGIELNMIREFVERKASVDDRIVLLTPEKSVGKMLKEKGYPFKSKQHSKWLYGYQKNGKTDAVKNYLGEGDKRLYRPCPKILKYQFTEDFKIKVSDKCCEELKEKPLDKYAKDHNKKIRLLGLMREEGGRRMDAKCLAFVNGKLKSFQPMVAITKEWEEWYIEKYSVEICAIYGPPYNFPRTGCKGCPFAIHLQKELDILEEYFPNERKQCEILWKPIYDEYRRIGYRLKDDKYKQMTLFDGGVV